MFSSQNSQVSGAAADPYFNQTTLLLHGDGTNGAQNNTFLDSSTNNFAITRNGNTTQGTFTPFSQAAGYWANYFNDGTQGLFLPTSSNLDLSGDFTIEGWFFKNGTTDKVVLGSDYPTRNIQIAFDQANVVGSTGIYNGSSWQLVTCSSSPNSQWFHLAFVRSGTTVTVYLNGISQGTFTSSTNYRFTNGAIAALRGYNLGGWAGYISNFRIVNGTAVYTANFTPSTTPLTTITNTSLLTCQSNRFVDNSTNNFTLTANGNVAVQPFSPFLPTAAYSPTVNGGSGYFDGNTLYPLRVPNNSAFNLAGNFTVQVWHYADSFTYSAGNNVVFLGSDFGASINQQIGLSTSNNAMVIYTPSTGLQSSSTISGILGAWNHYAYVRNGSTVTFYFNGINVGSVTNSATFQMANGAFGTLGGYLGRPAGYLSDLSVNNSTAQYTTNFTPPTAPIASTGTTTCLLSFTNAGIFDNAMKNDLETVGNAQISTAVVKYGTGSMYFDGTGDWLALPSSQNFAPGVGDWTIECWLYPISGNWAIVSGSNFYINNNGGTVYVGDQFSDIIFVSPPPSTGTWTHIAVTKSGSTVRLFFAGTQVGSSTTALSTAITTSMLVGGRIALGATISTNGYIDDLRITKGVARYTANFTPPTAAFPNQ